MRPRLRLVEPGEVPPRIAAMRAERSARRVMAALLVPAAALVIIGLVFVLSASSVRAYAQYHNSFWYFQRQTVAALVGAFVALLAYLTPIDGWRKAWAPLVVASTALLVLVLSPFGTTAGGSTRWIALGSFALQPSELAKLAVAVAGAALLARNYRFVSEPVRMVLPYAVVVGLTAGLIMLQPDLGTTAIVCAIAAALLFAVGIRLRALALWFSVGIGAGLMVAMSTEYMRLRFEAFLHPWSNRTTSGYQVVQGMIALGSGHLFGVGLGASRQKWMYVPNAHTDFIFAIMGEEVGLFGELVVLALFASVIFAGVRIAIKAPNLFGRLLATGIVTWLGVQTLINLGGVTGLLPITGVPLPLLSYGGSSLIVTMAAIGVLAAIGRAGLWPDAGPRTRSRRRRGVRGARAGSRDAAVGTSRAGAVVSVRNGSLGTSPGTPHPSPRA
jgi:cell division protein FtsW